MTAFIQAYIINYEIMISPYTNYPGKLKYIVLDNSALNFTCDYLFNQIKKCWTGVLAITWVHG